MIVLDTLTKSCLRKLEDLLEARKCPFQLGVRVNIDPHHLVRLARDDVRRGVQHLLHEEVRAWDKKASVTQGEDEP